MPYLNIDGKRIYYEIHGRGEPLLILNGIMMNTLSWVSFVKDYLNEYEVILIDLIDQGKSDRADGPYNIEMHVSMLRKFLDCLNYEKINLFGISYGGEVAMLFALRNQERLKSLILSNTTSNAMKDLEKIKKDWDLAARTCNPSILFKATMPYIYSDKFYNENFKILRIREKLMERSLTKNWFDGFRRTLNSARDFNVTDELKKIEIPVLIIGSELDNLTPIHCQEEIKKEIKGAELIVIRDTGHASMYENPEKFGLILVNYLRMLEK